MFFEIRTFLARDESKYPALFCVIKELNCQGLSGDDFEKERNGFLEKSLRLKSLKRYRNKPQFLDFFYDEQCFYWVEEFIAGRNLAEVMKEEGNFNEDDIWQLLTEVLPQLKVLHDQGLIHGDIKPENLIFSSLSSVEKCSGSESTLRSLGGDIDVVLVDGLVRCGQKNFLGGSAEFMAPEQVKGSLAFYSDLYSLGACCLYFLTGISPFQLFDVGSNCWVWRYYLLTKVSEGLGEVLDKLVENSLKNRFLSVDAVIEEVKKNHKWKQINTNEEYSIFVDKSLSGVKNSLWECRQTLGDFSGPVNGVAIDTKGVILAVVSDDNKIRLWDLNSYELLNIIHSHSNFVKTVAFSLDGRLMASGSDDKTVKIYDLETWEELHSFTGHSHAVKSVAFHPQGEILASGSWDKTIRLWDINKKAEIGILKHNLQVTAVAFSPNGKWLASGSFDRTIRIWDMKGELRYVLRDHIWPVFAVAFSSDSKILATGSDDKTIKLWDVESGNLIRTISGHSWTVVSLAFMGNSEILISGSWDKTVKLWQVNTGEELDNLSRHSDSICAVAASSLSEIIVSGSKDKTVNIWHKLTDKLRAGKGEN
ncbi:MAG TPA: WD40 repeat domain-containing serine/threonine-protein kinase [Halomicronema sp.]